MVLPGAPNGRARRHGVKDREPVVNGRVDEERWSVRSGGQLAPDARRIALEMLERLGLTQHRGRESHTLSGGEKASLCPTHDRQRPAVLC